MTDWRKFDDEQEIVQNHRYLVIRKYLSEEGWLDPFVDIDHMDLKERGNRWQKGGEVMYYADLPDMPDHLY